MYIIGDLLAQTQARSCHKKYNRHSAAEQEAFA
jgi:hypothetical protein